MKTNSWRTFLSQQCSMGRNSIKIEQPILWKCEGGKCNNKIIFKRRISPSAQHEALPMGGRKATAYVRDIRGWNCQSMDRKLISPRAENSYCVRRKIFKWIFRLGVEAGKRFRHVYGLTFPGWSAIDGKSATHRRVLLTRNTTAVSKQLIAIIHPTGNINRSDAIDLKIAR